MNDMSKTPVAEPPRLNQFTIRRIMAATFWIAVVGGASGFQRSHADSGIAAFALIAATYICPFVAISAALIGREWTGLSIGLILAFAFAFVMLIVVEFGRILPGA